MSHRPAPLIAALMCIFMARCAGQDSSEPASLCIAGENIFCRCPGGDPGTKECLPNGQSFDACGPCEDRPSTGPGQQSSSQGTGGFGSGGFGSGGFGTGADGGDGGSGGVVTGDTPLLGTCALDSECQTGMCRDSFCTSSCTLVSECPYPQSECVSYQGVSICMPTCQSATDCTPYNAPPSQCGFASAVDNWNVTVCADWGAAHQLMPPGSDCLPFDHVACNLGYQQLQTVCTEQGVCAQGCYVNADCPTGTSCNGGAGLGNCI